MLRICQQSVSTNSYKFFVANVNIPVSCYMQLLICLQPLRLPSVTALYLVQPPSWELILLFVFQPSPPHAPHIPTQNFNLILFYTVYFAEELVCLRMCVYMYVYIFPHTHIRIHVFGSFEYELCNTIIVGV